MSEPLEWGSRPAREGGGRLWVATCVPLILWVAILLLLGPFWFLLSVLLLGGAIVPYFSLTRYRLDDEGVTVYRTFYTIHKSWREYRSYYPDRYGVLLSPFSRPSRLENFRGLYLRFTNNREEVLAFVKGKVGSDVEIEKESGHDLEN